VRRLTEQPADEIPDYWCVLARDYEMTAGPEHTMDFSEVSDRVVAEVDDHCRCNNVERTVWKIDTVGITYSERNRGILLCRELDANGVYIDTLHAVGVRHCVGQISVPATIIEDFAGQSANCPQDGAMSPTLMPRGPGSLPKIGGNVRYLKVPFLHTGQVS
jgi:hypothetical protein